MDRIVVRRAPLALAQGSARGSRVCGDCSACCKTLSVNSAVLKKPAGKWCQHWEKNTRCSIYADRPRPCRLFVCEWMKGVREECHRPDRTKVVLDFVKHSQGPPEGILQMWEVAEGSLTHPYAKYIAREVLSSGILVFHLYLSQRKKLFIPVSRMSLLQNLREVMKRERVELGSLRELEAA